MTDYNPNVFYELAIRHTRNKPAIHMVETGRKIPFDVAMVRTIFYSTSDIGDYKLSLEKLDQTIESLEKNPNEYDNPFLEFLNVQKMKESENAYEKVIANLPDDLASAMTQIKQLKNEITELKSKSDITTSFRGSIWKPDLIDSKSNSIYEVKWGLAT